jgi:hypothetical protein
MRPNPKRTPLPSALSAEKLRGNVCCESDRVTPNLPPWSASTPAYEYRSRPVVMADTERSRGLADGARRYRRSACGGDACRPGPAAPAAELRSIRSTTGRRRPAAPTATTAVLKLGPADARDDTRRSSGIATSRLRCLRPSSGDPLPWGRSSPGHGP